MVIKLNSDRTLGRIELPHNTNFVKTFKLFSFKNCNLYSKFLFLNPVCTVKCNFVCEINLFSLWNELFVMIIRHAAIGL
jgi:hypothetical protein